jgi:endonuclease YncB( thermonuclease family)
MRNKTGKNGFYCPRYCPKQDMHMKKILITLLLFLFAPLNAFGGGQEAVFEVVAVYDGDTIVMARQDTPAIKIRLADIDAPEHDQDYGSEARQVLQKLLDGCHVHFMPVDIDHYGRNVAMVTACGKNVNAEMVRQGAAWVYTRYNKDESLPALEADAKAAKRGLWANPAPINPEDWRHAK